MQFETPLFLLDGITLCEDPGMFVFEKGRGMVPDPKIDFGRRHGRAYAHPETLAKFIEILKRRQGDPA